MALVLCLYIAKCQKYLHISKKCCTFAPEIVNSVSSAYLHVQYKILQGKFPKSQKKHNIWGKSQSVSCIFQKNVVTLLKFLKLCKNLLVGNERLRSWNDVLRANNPSLSSSMGVAVSERLSWWMSSSTASMISRT